MRIREIHIRSWRHFENIGLSLPDVGLVCIVGANGTGKSHILELVASCAHRLGLAQGIEIPRGDPFSDQHEFSLSFYLSIGVSSAIDQGLQREAGFPEWDRTLTISSFRNEQGARVSIVANGISDAATKTNFAQRVVEALRNSADVHFLSLDADRSYPTKNIHVNEIAQAYEIDWSGSEYTKGRSFRSSTTLYDEWIKYFLARENQAGTSLIKDIRNARLVGDCDPSFTDHFNDYKEALCKVLPHVVFTGVDSKKRTLLFDTTGLELTFNNLSGGEREIAFQIGQIDRFRLRHGLFLLDEPELHLNADLIRSWVAYLTSTVETGQIWLATHSLEAVEAAGQQATFILERNAVTRKVNSLARLDSRPILSALSRAVGTPAFSIRQLKFVFIEGEEGVGEREKYRRLAGASQDVRFLECGSCNEVGRRVQAIRSLDNAAEAGIRIGGVVDGDFRQGADLQSLRESGVHILEVHEYENFFLHSATLAALFRQNGRTEIPQDIVLNAADQRAGSWIFQYAMATPNARDLPELPSTTKEQLKSLPWSRINGATDTIFAEPVNSSQFDATAAGKLVEILRIAARAYERNRSEPTLWIKCEGKQVLSDVARFAGFRDISSLMQAAFVLWDSDPSLIPQQLQSLRNYVNGL